MIKEFAIGSVANRHHFKAINEVSAFHGTAQNMFHSLYDYDEYAIEFVKKNKKMSGYDGMLYMPEEFILDVDGSNLEEAKLATQGLSLLLNDMYIPFQIYISGTGFHVHIPRSSFRWKPSKELHLKVKAELDSHGIFDFADIAVTDKTRLIRIPYTLNTKNNLWKTPLTESELNGNINSIIELAKKPRLGKNAIILRELETDVPAFDVTKKIKKKSINNALVEGDVLGYKPDPINYPCIQQLMSDPQVGERHAAALRVSSHLRWRFPEEIVRAVMESWRLKNSSDAHPFKEDEMDSIVKSAYEGHGGKGNNYGCEDKLKDKYCQNTCRLYKAKKSNKILDASSMEKMLAEFYLRDVAPLNLGEMCNQDFPIFPGELVVLQAPPASMKTMLVQNIMQFFKKNTYFLELEMSPRQIWQRFVMIEMGWDKQRLKDHYKSFQNGMDDKFSWLNVDFEPCFAGELQKRIDQLALRPEIVVIDHIGLMKAKGNDSNFRNEEVSQGLMELARRNDIIVFAISEISKSAFHDGSLDMASSKGSFRQAYNAHKILSLVPYRSQDANESSKIKQLHVYTSKDREGETLNARFNVNGIRIES
tara:strand:+ start:1027 stop:2799 length:1773 start_codon:yes stop_codon:yes gene_type:complete